MRKSRLAEEQILGVLAEAEQVPIGEVCRRHGISPRTCYRWKARYDGMSVSEAWRLSSSRRRTPD